jgi:hypothetical protein
MASSPPPGSASPPAWGGGTRVSGSTEQLPGREVGSAPAPDAPLPSGTSQSSQAAADEGGASQTNARRPGRPSLSSGRNSRTGASGDPVPSGLPDATQAPHNPGSSSPAPGAAAVTGGLVHSALEPPAAVKKPQPVKVANASVARPSLGNVAAASSAPLAPHLSAQSSADSLQEEEHGMVRVCGGASGACLVVS